MLLVAGVLASGYCMESSVELVGICVRLATCVLAYLSSFFVKLAYLSSNHVCLMNEKKRKM
jgi:hypothetical protein